MLWEPSTSYHLSYVNNDLKETLNWQNAILCLKEEILEPSLEGWVSDLQRSRRGFKAEKEYEERH